MVYHVIFLIILFDFVFITIIPIKNAKNVTKKQHPKSPERFEQNVNKTNQDGGGRYSSF